MWPLISVANLDKLTITYKTHFWAHLLVYVQRELQQKKEVPPWVWQVMGSWPSVFTQYNGEREKWTEHQYSFLSASWLNAMKLAVSPLPPCPLHHDGLYSTPSHNKLLSINFFYCIFCYSNEKNKYFREVLQYTSSLSETSKSHNLFNYVDDPDLWLE